jgi:hypothetical protein
MRPYSSCFSLYPFGRGNIWGYGAKVLVFLLTLGFAASAFAINLVEGLTLAGEVKAGLSVNSGDDGKDATDDTTAKAWNNDAGQINRARLTFAYTGGWGGAKIRLQSLGFAGAVTAPYAYGWANLLDGKIVVSGGDIGDDLWGLGKLANVFDPNLDAVDGARVEFKLFDGLSFGYALPLTEGAIGDVFGSSIVGALFKSSFISGAFGLALHPGTDKVEAGKDTWSFVSVPVDGSGNEKELTETEKEQLVHGTQEDGDKYDPTGITYGNVWRKTAGSPAVAAYDPWLDVILGVEVNPIDVLKIVVDARIDTRKYADGKTSFDPKSAASADNRVNDKNGYIRIGPLVQFASGPLTAHVRGDITLQNDGFGKDSTDKANKGQPVNYASTKALKLIKDAHANWVNVENLGDMSIAFRVGGDYKFNSTVNAYLQVGSDNVAWFAGNGLYVKPGVKIALGTASIEIFDKLGQIGADKTKVATDDLASPSVAVKAHSPFTNQFQIDFNWIF